MKYCIAYAAVTILILAGYVPAYGGSWSLSLGGYSTEIAYDIKQTADGGYIVAGVTSSFTNANDAWVLKLGPSGEVEWQKTYGGAGYNSANSIQQTTDDGNVGYIVAGYTNGDAWVLKLDTSGNVVWQRTYGGTGFDSAGSIQQAADGGYIVAGFTGSFGGTNGDAWVLKLTANGAIDWQKTYGGTADSDEAVAIQQTEDGGYIVAGSTHCSGAGNSDALILKLSENGSIEWQKTYGGAAVDGAAAIQQTADQGYIVTGYTNSFGAGGLDAWLLKLTENGTESWQKTWGGPGGDSFASVRQTSDGYIVAGTTGSSGAGNGDAWVLKLSDNGSVVWQKTYGGAAGDSANSIRQTSDGGYIVAGMTASLGMQTFDVWVMKLEQDGGLSGCYSIGESANVPQNTAAGTISSSALASDSSTATAVNSQATTATPTVNNSICSSTQPQLTLTVSKSGQGTGTVTSSPSGISCGTKCSHTFNNHASITLTATPSSGSFFAGWESAEGCSTGACTVTLSDYDRSVTALFTTIVNGTCGSSQGQSFNTAPSQNLCLSGTPSVVQYNGQWVWTCTGSTGGATANCWANITQIGLSVSKTGNGTVTSNPEGINCGDDCGELYPYGTSVTLTATPESGFTFGGWNMFSGCSTNPCTLSMMSPVNSGVTFLLDPKARTGGTAFGTLKTAHNAVTGNGTIEAKAVTFAENLTLELGKFFTLKGGYADDYLTRNGYTTLDGNLTIGSGGLTVDRLVLK